MEIYSMGQIWQGEHKGEKEWDYKDARARGEAEHREFDYKNVTSICQIAEFNNCFLWPFFKKGKIPPENLRVGK